MVNQIRVPDIAGTIQRAGEGFRRDRNDRFAMAQSAKQEKAKRYQMLSEQLKVGTDKLAAMRAGVVDKENPGEFRPFVETLASTAAIADKLGESLGFPATLTQQVSQAAQAPLGWQLAAAEGTKKGLTTNAETATTDAAAIGQSEGTKAAAKDFAAASGAAELGTPGVVGRNASAEEAAQLAADSASGLPGQRGAAAATEDVTKRKAIGDLLVNTLGEDVSPEEAEEIRREALGLSEEEYGFTALNIALARANALKQAQKGEPLSDEQLTAVEAVLDQLRADTENIMATLFGGSKSAPKSAASTGLTPEEQAELETLKNAK